MKNFFFLSLFLLPHFVKAQSGMTLDECIRLAWKQNPSVRNSVIDIKEARADYMAAVGAFLPRAAVNATLWAFYRSGYERIYQRNF